MPPIQSTQIYQYAYNTAKNLAYGRAKGAAIQSSKFYREGLFNPAKAKLARSLASKNLAYEILATEPRSNFKKLWDILKTTLEANFKYRSIFKEPMKNFNEEYKTLYPKTHKMRDKLIQDGKVHL